MNPTILTATGVYFDFLQPHVDMVRLEDIAHALANTCRFGGHTRPFYSVAQHSVLASRIVAPEYARAALMHDAAEAYLGDVPKPLKRLLPDYQRIEQRVEAVTLARFGLSLPLPVQVQRADLVLLATEQRDLMPYHEDKWGCIARVTPLPDPIVPVSPDEAREMFLARWDELFGGWEGNGEIGPRKAASLFGELVKAFGGEMHAGKGGCAMTALAIVNINHIHYLLPRAKALKVAKLMGEAVEVKQDWGSISPNKYTLTGSRPTVQLVMVDPSQIDFPADAASPAPRKAARSPARLK